MSDRPVVVGSGAAGLMTALSLAERRPILLCGGALGGEAASGWAQGGIAAAMGADDSPGLHAADTMAAGAGLCDAAAVSRIIEAGPWAIETLLGMGARFERAGGGELALGLEAAHGRRRIVHARDATGAEVMRVLRKAVSAEARITVLAPARATAIEARDGAVRGVAVAMPEGRFEWPACFVILATGGVGGLFAQSTNPRGAVGGGIALAARAGASLRDMEFVQFHPTALDAGLDPMPLVSEALRGEGARLVDETGAQFVPGGDLQPRDVVARAVAAKYAAGGRVFLDARGLDGAKFPTVFGRCRDAGIDPARTPIPVRPAAHYHMGGVAVNAACESDVSGLFACGEVAATGLHGANRLASNSLLEAMVTARLAAAAILGRAAPGGTARPTRPPARRPGPMPEIREICSKHLGILRNETGLAEAAARLGALAGQCDAALVALLIAEAARRRTESRGAHGRADYPLTDPGLAHSARISLKDLRAMRLAA